MLLGEVHGSVAQHRFLQRMLRDPRLPTTISIIAVEFANARYQPVIDRFAEGDAVPEGSLRQAWQNAIGPLAWDARIYPAFFQAIRSVNRDLPRQKRLRVLALDPPVLWDSVQTADAIPRKWGYRDPVWFEILEKEVFALHHKALVIAGALHIIRRDPVARFQAAPLAKAGLGDAIAQRYPSAAYAVYPLLGSAGLAALVRHWNPGSLGDVQGTSLGARSSHELLPGHFTLFTMVNGKRVPRLPEESAYPPIDGLVDAVVYDGPDPSTAPLLLTPYRRARYVAEMHRRSRIVQPIFGQDLDATVDSLARRA